ncbi:MAG: BLUF domain-containing protein [Gammaproteobacteria bacterium]|nr:BLUF domain-containing protein [Gammaproteobacteria bacterium]
MYALVYVSSATTLFSEADLVALLAQSREKNAGLGISGMLLYKEGNFMQVLEGEKSAVLGLMDAIQDDPRHHGVIIINQGDAPRRQFGDWSMGFRNLDDPALRATPGYSPFLNTPITGDVFTGDEGRCWELLHLFRATM